jgi:CRP/FNR family transcriptional regulator, cyclic AMP receptor protein
MSEHATSVEELRAVGLFGALPESALEYLAERLTVLVPSAGDFVFREGDAALDFFVVIAGEMEVLKHSNDGFDVRVALLGPGDWFGEMSILDVQPRSASVRALAPSRLLRISAADLDALYRHDLKAYALIMLNVARELSRRLRVADGLLADFLVNVMGRYVDRPKHRAN